MWPRVSWTLCWKLTCMLWCWHRSSSHHQWLWAPRLVLRGDTSQICGTELSGVQCHHRHGGALPSRSVRVEITWLLLLKVLWLKSCASVQPVFWRLYLCSGICSNGFLHLVQSPLAGPAFPWKLRIEVTKNKNQSNNSQSAWYRVYCPVKSNRNICVQRVSQLGSVCGSGC